MGSEMCIRDRKFPGQNIPFGAIVDVRPPTPILKQMPKFAPRSVPAIFLGYFLQPHGRWRQEYLAAPLEDFKSDAGAAEGGVAASSGKRKRVVRIFRIKEVVVDKTQPWRFPLRDVRDRVSRVVNKADPKRTGIDVAEGSLPEGSDASVPPPPSVIGGVMGTRIISDEHDSDSAPLQAADASLQAAGSDSAPLPAAGVPLQAAQSQIAPLRAADAPLQAAELTPQRASGADSVTGSSSSFMAPAAVPPVRWLSPRRRGGFSRTFRVRNAHFGSQCIPSSRCPGV